MNLFGTNRGRVQAMTLVETLMVMGLIVILITATLGSIFAMQLSTARVSDHNSAMALVEAKINDVRAVYYNPPTYPFTTNTVTITNQNAIDLNEAGTTFMVPGTLLTKIEPQGTLGHLVTVTATFQTPRLPMTVSLQTIVNKYSGGQQ